MVTRPHRSTTGWGPLVGFRMFLSRLSSAIVILAVSGAPTVAPPSLRINNEVVHLAAPVPRPGGARCVVELIPPHDFNGDAPLDIEYRPPPGCPGEWSKVVLESDFAVSKGNQYDRSADLQLGGVTLFLGTTMEPGKDYAPRWHVERDVTDYSTLLRKSMPGRITLRNHIDADHNGRISWRARLIFYRGRQPSTTPSLVMPVTGGLLRIDQDRKSITTRLILPRNMIRVALDLILQGQESEEFWFDCFPVHLADQRAFWLRTCPAPYRDVEIRIDEQLAGTMPVEPTVFTGGINPALWRRAPAIDALNLPVAHIDLTPFAGLLNDGKAHRITVGIPAAETYFRVSASLVATLDPRRRIVPGHILYNRLSPARVTSRTTPVLTSGNSAAAIVTSAEQSGSVSGHLVRDIGKVVTTVRYVMAARLENIQGIGKKSWSMTRTVSVVTRHGTKTRVAAERRVGTLVIDNIVRPARYGTKFGTEIAQHSDIRTSINGTTTWRDRQWIRSFAPTYSAFLENKNSPNYVYGRRYTFLSKQSTWIAAFFVHDDIARQSSDMTHRAFDTVWHR